MSCKEHDGAQRAVPKMTPPQPQPAIEPEADTPKPDEPAPESCSDRVTLKQFMDAADYTIRTCDSMVETMNKALQTLRAASMAVHSVAPPLAVELDNQITEMSSKAAMLSASATMIRFEKQLYRHLDDGSPLPLLEAGKR